MALYRQGSNLLRFSGGGLLSSGSGSGDITPVLIVEYVDDNGVRQRVTNPSSLTGTAPFLVLFDATETRSIVDTTARAAWESMGYRANYGEGRGTTWPISGASRDEDLGPPIFHYVYETPGSYTFRLRIRASNGSETTVAIPVTINAPPSPTIIEVSAGAWPTFTSGSHYQLRAGGDYRSFGSLSLNGLHNVIISKVGSGADPRIATWYPDSRNVVNTPNLQRARGCRLVNIDVERWGGSAFGWDYCGVVNGRVRAYAYGAPGFYWSGRTANEQTNIRFARGTFFWNTGEMTQLDNNYAFIDDPLRSFAFIGGTMVKNGSPFGGGAHVLRGIFDHSSIRHSLFVTDTTNNVFGWWKIGGGEVAGVSTPDDWPANDLVGIIGGRELAIPSRYLAATKNQFGRAGDVVSGSFGVPGFAPQNNDAGSPVEGLEYVAFEDNFYFRSNISSFAVQNVDLGGRYMSNRNNRINMGAGAHTTANTSKNANRIPSGWDGPYLDEATNTRPVPSAF